MGGCPGSRMMEFNQPNQAAGDETGSRPAELRQWPIQMHLISPQAPYFHGADLLLAADCVAFAVGDFHRDYLKGKSVAIACPKLDAEQAVYEQKLIALIDEAQVNTINVMIMEVPCCGGLLQMARSAVEKATRKVPIKCTVVGVRGEIQAEEWAA